jgi:hypothetical protein
MSENKAGVDCKESNMITSHSPLRALQFNYSHLNPPKNAFIYNKIIKPTNSYVSGFSGP